MNNEIWKDVKGYEGLYQVSDQGRVMCIEHYDCYKRLIRPMMLKPYSNDKGFVVIDLYDFNCNKKVFKVLDLVNNAFNCIYQ